MRLLTALLLFPLGVGADTFHVCPAVDGTNVALEYGTEDGSSEANCYPGFAAMVTAAAVSAGDTVNIHGTYYFDKGYAWASGTSGSPITFECDDCLFWYSIDVSGSNSVAASGSFWTQGVDASEWQLVSGTTNVWKKGIASSAYKMWVDSTELRPAATVPATQNDAGAVAVMTVDNTFIQTTEDTDSLANTLYYKGTLSDDMRVNNQSQYREDYVPGGFLINGFDYITVNDLAVKGYRVNAADVGNLSVQNCTGCIFNRPHLYEGMTGARLSVNTDLVINDPNFHDNSAQNVAITGSAALMDANYNYQQISGVSTANPTEITTRIAHGLSNGDVVVFESLTAVQEIEDNSDTDSEYVVTVTGDTTFTVPVNVTSTYSANNGVLHIFGTDSGTTINDGVIERACQHPRYNGVDLSWFMDCDGLGVGYNGGTVSNLTLSGTKYHYNGPPRAVIAGEASNVTRGSGVFIGTAHTNEITGARILGNWFKENQRTNLNFTAQGDSTIAIASNLFDGLQTNGTATDRGHVRIEQSEAGTNRYEFAHNILRGASGGYGVSLSDTYANQTWKVHNNIFGPLTASTGSTWAGMIVWNSASSEGGLAESHNRFVGSAPDDVYFTFEETTFEDVATYATASSVGGDDEIVSSIEYVGGPNPTTAEGFKLQSGSPLIDAGTCYRTPGCAHTDYRGRNRGAYPGIGPYKQSSGDAAAQRQPR